MGLYWANFLILIVLWIWKLIEGSLDWQSVAIGVWTGIFVTTWAIELTGNKTPNWMRR
jgi:multisubunit Na+/H+ antiporter MnhE subunit